MAQVTGSRFEVSRHDPIASKPMKHLKLTERAARLYEVRDTTGTTVVGYIQYDIGRNDQPCGFAFFPKDVELMFTAETLTGALMKHFDDTVTLSFNSSVS